MSLRYGFFDSEITGYDEEGMPVFDRAESSDFLAMFISKIISDGVLALPGDCFQVVAHSGMTLKVRPGFGIIRGRFAYDNREFTVTLSDAPRSYKRIDRVILRANYLHRLCEIVVKTGTPGVNPVPPELLQPASGDYYELCLATVAVNSNQTVITQANITDTRYDSRVCGVVTQVIDHLDTSVFFGQLNKFYEEFVENCETSYETSVNAMNNYLTALKTSGDSQLAVIAQSLKDFSIWAEQNFLLWSDGMKNDMAAFQAQAEQDFQVWFDTIKGQLSSDPAGNLQLQVDELKQSNDKLTVMLLEVTDMLISGNVEACLTDSDNQVLLAEKEVQTLENIVTWLTDSQDQILVTDGGLGLWANWQHEYVTYNDVALIANWRYLRE